MEEFDAAWSAAIDHASKKLLDDAFERALGGTDEPIFDRDGRRVGRRFRQSDKLLMFLLRAYMPDRFRYAVRETRMPNESTPSLARIADAIALLGEEFERGLEDAKRDGSRRPPLTDEEWEAHRKMLMG